MTTLLRVCTAGSVDDGKSTLIGRLLFDAKALMSDQLSQVEEASRRRGFARTELALVTDGLRAEREQGITIDVAWRYFSVPGRRFILADTPGHVQYTRNMVTGASTAEVALLLVDARQGLTEQSRRHLYLTTLLGVRHLVVAINKMDQVDFSFERFAEIREIIDAYLRQHTRGASSVVYVPVSALHGDNVVTRSDRSAFYQGPTLLEHLTQLDTVRDVADAPFRMPVQWIVRPQTEAHHDYRGIAGRIAAGTVRVGDAVTIHPSGKTTRVKALETSGASVEEARRGASVTVHLDDDVDVSRGDLLAAAPSPPRVDRELTADLAWFARRPAESGKRYLLKHTTRTARATLVAVEHVVDVTSGEPLAKRDVDENDIARVTLKVAAPLVWEPYETDRTLGSALLVDETTHETLGGLMLR